MNSQLKTLIWRLHKRIFTLLMVLCIWSPSVVAQPSIVFGVVPQQSATKLVQQWQPLLQRWGDLAGVEIKFATARDIPTFEARLMAGAYDIAYMNPYHFTLVNQNPGYTALARAKNKRITGIIVARRGKPVSLMSCKKRPSLFLLHEHLLPLSSHNQSWRRKASSLRLNTLVRTTQSIWGYLKVCTLLVVA